MAGGGVVLTRPSALRISEYHGRLTFFVVMVAAVAASGGLLFGYDNGCIGGVLAFPEFEQKFFPDVYAKKEQALASETSPYCTYDNATIQIFTSSFFLAGMFSSLFAAKVTRTFGRKLTMGFGSLLFIAGGLVNALAQNVAMLVVGRLLLGFGVGFVNQVVPLYLSEMAPYQYRGGLNVCFQLCITIGILVAQLVNYGVQDWDKGWRLSLGLAGAPAVILLIGAILLPESPNFLIEKGKPEQGRRVLQRLRGTTKVDAEFDDIVDAVEVGRGIRMRESWRSLLTRRYQPQLITTFLINLFQQFTGINAIIFYVPVLFSSLGTGKSAALLNTVVIGCVNVGSTLVSVVSVDKFGRKFLLIEGGIQCCLAMIATGVVLGVEFGNYAGSELPKGVAIGVLVVICVFISGFAWSWGPLGWLVPSEIYTLETRAAGTATAVFANFLFTFIIGQTFLSMLCAMRFGVFLFFAAFLVIMVLWVIFFLPETKGVPVERVSLLFAKHWFWKKWMGPAAEQVLAEAEARTASRKAAQLEGAALPTPGAGYATGPPPSMISAEAPRV